jgi:hypothetical protein
MKLQPIIETTAIARQNPRGNLNRPTGKSRTSKKLGGGLQPELKWNENCLRSDFVYFNELLIELNVPLTVVPRVFTAAMIASAIPAAIRPYSIAVAADSSRMKRAKRLVIGDS